MDKNKRSKPQTEVEKNLIKNILNIDSIKKTTKSSNIEEEEDEINKDLWVPDDQANTCFNCGKDFFGIILRRHHCRICGNVFCKDCYTSMNQEREMKVCEYCKLMYSKYDTLLNESLVDYKESKAKKTYETKLNDYQSKVQKMTDDIKQFININDNGTNEMIKKKINELFTIFAKKTIEKTLKSSSNPDLYSNWFDIICKLTIEIIQQVSPSFQDLNDLMDINEYVKIKTIPYIDQSLSRVIDGFAFQKNVCTKKMRTHIYNPKILLLDCGLDGKRNEAVQMPNILTQEPAYLEILKKKIETINPQVILVNKNASHKFQEDFSGSKMNISLVTNVKQTSLNKIARCTKTYVLPSADLIGKQITLGQCYQFRIEKIKISSNDGKSKQFFKSNEYNLMIFEGCGKLLYYTMILSGPIKDELKEVKKLLKEIILRTLRDLFLQQYLLYYFNVDIFQVQEFPLESHIFSMSEKDFSYGFDTQIINKDNTGFDMVQLSLLNKTKGDSSNQSINQTYVIVNSIQKDSRYSNMTNCNSNNDQNQIMTNTNEAEILKSVYTVCGKSEEVTMNCYSNDFNEDKPLGKIILDLCQEREDKCKTCLRTYSNHTKSLYKENGRIMISLITNSEYQMEEVLAYISTLSDFPFNKSNNVDQFDIFSYGYCSICQEIVTPLIKLPKELFNFSATKFFKHVLFNHNIKNFNCQREYNINHLSSQNCEHYLYRDISRIFFSKIGAIRFSFDPQKVYGFDPHLQIENISGANQTSTELQLKLIKTQDFCFDILEMIKTQISQYNIDIKGINGEHATIISTQLEKTLKINERLTQEVNQLFKLVALFFHEKYNNELKINVTIKQIYKMLAQVKFLYNSISKIIRRIKIICFVSKVKEISNEQPRVSVTSIVGGTEKQIPTHNQMMEEFNKKNEEFIRENKLIYSIDSNSNYQILMNILRVHDNKHNIYSSEIIENNICGFISCLLTSDEYLERINAGNKIKLNEIERIILNKKQKCPDEEDLYQTSLLYDFSQISFSYTGMTEDKIRQQLETCLLSDDKEPFTINCNFDLVEFIESSLKDKIKNEPVITSSKINCAELLVNLKKIKSDLDLTASELKEIKRTYIGDMKSKFKSAKLKFVDEEKSETKCQMTAYYSKQFEAMRILYCSSYEDFILSISNFKDWEEVSGGKSKANFFKSVDSKYIIKCVNKIEFQMFIESGFHYYFYHMNKFLVHKMPSALTKILGAYKIKLKGNKNETIYCIVMENLFYGLNNLNQLPLPSYDLKGSKINRYIPKKNQKPNQVLLDTNFLEDFNGEPLPLDIKIYTLFKSAIKNDCLILSKMTVVDYSLLLIIIEDKKNEHDSKKKEKGTIRIGILDYLRKYTWDKQLETVGKTIIHKFLSPTIINPNDYRKRFVDKICNYFIGV